MSIDNAPITVYNIIKIRAEKSPPQEVNTMTYIITYKQEEPTETIITREVDRKHLDRWLDIYEDFPELFKLISIAPKHN